MKLDATVLRTMDKTDFRVLEAIETGMKSHYIVPLPLITSTANLRHGGSHKIVSTLLRDKLLSHERKGGADGYRLTNAGYDILALHSLKCRGQVAALGQKIGTGKESDIYLAVQPSGQQIVLKFHRLGRTSFRNIRQKRDYIRHPQNVAHSWLFLSTLSARKEYSFMKALYEVGYPTPVPYGHNRHVVCMSLVRGVPLYQIRTMSTGQANSIYEQTIQMAERLAQQHGLVHCDLNEFNLLVDLSGIQHSLDNASDPYVRHSGMSVLSKSTETVGQLSKPAWEQSLEANDNVHDLPEPKELLENGEPKPIVTLIDFPQMISTQHPNAQQYYERDFVCLKKFFEQKLHCDIQYEIQYVQETATERLDEVLRASGVSHDDAKYLELYYFQSGPAPVGTAIIGDGDSADDKDDEQAEQNSTESREDAHQLESGDHIIPSRNIEFETPLDDDTPDSSPMVPLGDELSVMGVEELQRLTREELEEMARKRVRQTMNIRKKNAKRQGAFRKRNRNKGKVSVSESACF